MVEYSAAGLDRVFRALADPTRRAMVQSLASRPHTVTELAEPFEISLAAASKHIQVLERAGLVRRTVRGRTHTCRLDPGPLRDGIAWMRRWESFWSERLDLLEARLKADDLTATASGQPAAPPAAPPEPATLAAADQPISTTPQPTAAASRSPAHRQSTPDAPRSPARGPRIAPRATNRRNRP